MLASTAAGFASGIGYGVADNIMARPSKRQRRAAEHITSAPAAGYFGDYVSGRRVVGRKPSWSSTRKKLNRELYNSYVFYFGRLSKLVQPVTNATSSSVYGGALNLSTVRSFQLNNWVDSSTSPTLAEYPIHLYEVTQRQQTSTNRKFGHYLTDSNTGVGWGYLTGKTPAQNNAEYLELWSKRLPGDMLDVEYAVMKKLELHLTMQGGRNVPITFYVRLVRFTDVGLEPGATHSLAASGFWRRMAHRLIGHPDGKNAPIQPHPLDKTFKVLKSYKYELMPSNSTDGLSGPPIRRERIVFNLNRFVDFSKKSDDTVENAGSIAQVDDANTVNTMNPVATTTYNFLPDVRQRLYVMISATSPYQYVNSTQNLTWDPDLGIAAVGTITPGNPPTWTPPASNLVQNIPQYDARFYVHYVAPDK